jgi:hypothetical protein
MLTPKRREKIQKELVKIRSRHVGHGCWVCGSRRSLKTSRMSCGLRCRKCFEAGTTLPDVVLFEKLTAEIELGHKPRPV